ncbi:MAG: cobalt-precorrin-5B (C(1))-methyltransferase CbiD [Syntrophobacteraceae bacterium]
MSSDQSSRGKKREGLRRGFSTGTAAVAAAVAALRCLVSGSAPPVVAVRLPSGVYLPVTIARCRAEGGFASATVIKDGGDDPDITNRAEICCGVRLVADGGVTPDGVFLIAGEGVGVVTKPGLPVRPGEPAINPVPRRMFADNLFREMLAGEPGRIRALALVGTRKEGRAGVFVPFDSALPEELAGMGLEVTVEAPGGEALARHTLNPRLGIVGGISILGTTGIVKPFSHEAYEDTIHAALSVAASNGCSTAVLSTGGKSEKFARELISDEPSEAFVQIADFFAFSVREARRFGFRRIVHSVFFGKAVKMAQGHDYTHAHKAALDLELLAGMAGKLGYDAAFCRELASANTARHALEIIFERGAVEIVEAVAEKALARSAHLAGQGASLRLLLFDYNGDLLMDASLES